MNKKKRESYADCRTMINKAKAYNFLENKLNYKNTYENM